MQGLALDLVEVAAKVNQETLALLVAQGLMVILEQMAQELLVEMLVVRDLLAQMVWQEVQEPKAQLAQMEQAQQAEMLEELGLTEILELQAPQVIKVQLVQMVLVQIQER
jgi:hypothetical protein